MNYNINCLSIGQNKNNEFVLAYVSKYFSDMNSAPRIDIIKNELILDFKQMSFYPIKNFFKFKNNILTNEEIKQLSLYIKTDKFKKIYNKSIKRLKAKNNNS